MSRAACRRSASPRLSSSSSMPTKLVRLIAERGRDLALRQPGIALDHGQHGKLRRADVERRERVEEVLEHHELRAAQHVADQFRQRPEVDVRRLGLVHRAILADVLRTISGCWRLDISGLDRNSFRSCLARRRVASVAPNAQQSAQHARAGQGGYSMALRAIAAWCRAGVERERRARAGQDLRAAPVALGAAVASAAEGAGGLGRFDREGLERHHQVQDLSRRSSSARRSTITTWRATASPTSPM